MNIASSIENVVTFVTNVVTFFMNETTFTTNVKAMVKEKELIPFHVNHDTYKFVETVKLQPPSGRV
jgi:hypothetical protein